MEDESDLFKDDIKPEELKHLDLKFIDDDVVFKKNIFIETKQNQEAQNKNLLEVSKIKKQNSAIEPPEIYSNIDLEKYQKSKEIDLKTLVISQDHYLTYRISFQSNSDMTDLILETPHLTVPFGLEGNKDRKNCYNLDLSLIYQRQDQFVKFFNKIKEIDILFMHLSEMTTKKKLSSYLLGELSGKKYCSCIKDRQKVPVLRTKIYSSSPLILMDKHEKKVELNTIKRNTQGIFKIKLSNIWIHGNLYGIIWVLTEAILFV
jgi:hypothetical protein